MDGAGVCVAWMILESRNRRSKALARRRRLARARRRRIFVQRQAQERFFFTLVLSMVAFNLC